MSALVNFLQTQESRSLARGMTNKQEVTIGANSSISVPCKVMGCCIDRRIPVLFEIYEICKQLPRARKGLENNINKDW